MSCSSYLDCATGQICNEYGICVEAEPDPALMNIVCGSLPSSVLPTDTVDVPVTVENNDIVIAEIDTEWSAGGVVFATETYVLTAESSQNDTKSFVPQNLGVSGSLTVRVDITNVQKGI